jgi:hypothetical protein
LKLIAIHAELFFASGDDKALPLSFRLTLSDHGPLRLTGGNSGDTLVVDEEALPTPFRWEDERTEIRDVIALLSSHLQNMEVDRIDALRMDDRQVGLSLVSREVPTFHFWVDGDEFFWGNDLQLAWHWQVHHQTPLRGGPITLTSR